MRWYLTFILINLASCSTTPDYKLERIPSSETEEFNCLGLFNPFLKTHKEIKNKYSLIENGLITRSDLTLLDGDLLAGTLPKNKSQREQMEVSYLLIKKRFPHFDQEQILVHFQLLKKSCGV